MTSSKIKRVVLIQPKSVGGNFEFSAIPRQGMLFLSGALKQWSGLYLYDREIWFEDRSGKIDPDKDLAGVDILMVSALINESPAGYEIAKQAKLYHPDIITLGGGPHMGPLAQEAINEGNFDVIVSREGEAIIGELCDVLISHKKGQDRNNALLKIPGISFFVDGEFAETPNRGVIAPDFVELPDFYAIRDLTSKKPMLAGVLETVRGCTEKCTYCQVIQQFLGYRMIKRETEIKRLDQLQEMASQGLIHTRAGKFSVFVSDDLHPPPLRAVKYRNERLERIKGWKGHTDGMYLICQTRAEIGQDPEIAHALTDIGMSMLYVGVESDNAKNLELVNKRQDPGQVYADMVTLNKIGFTLVAMTIIGLPHDTEESIMAMADWVTEISKYQTANLLTPLPATSNWTDLTPLDAKGNILPEGELRPYHLYTGRQFVHQDERWTMDQSRRLFNQYHSKLNPVDKLYERLFQMVERYRLKVSNTGKDFSETISVKRKELVATGKDLSDSISSKVTEVGETLKSISDTSKKNIRTVKQINIINQESQKPLLNEK